MPGILYIVASPIGNLEDITQRAVNILKKVNFILCEDTRVTKKLLEYYSIGKPLISYHHHSKIEKINYIISLLKEGKNLALLSDAGTPGISDPGNKLIEKIVEVFGKDIKIIPIPGPSAICAIASVAGMKMEKFLFLGFLPKKKKRKSLFAKIAFSNLPIIFFESSHRILKSLEELKKINNNLKVVVGKELTKYFEKIYRGKINQVLEELKKDKVKGEFVIIIKNDKR
ncbi:MAG: 16S rRNA (cytidine(1402)-2'-O)-methyltransferase [Minisyncoccia bacterium]